MAQFRLTGYKPKLSENDVERACLQVLALRGWKVLRLPVGLFKTLDGRHQTIGELGIPDYVALHPNHPGFFLEVKRPGGKLSKVQEIKIEQLQQGYRLAVAVVDSVDALAAWLGRHEKSGHEC
jgi:hypothetical protein